GFDFPINVDLIDRVEIIRGPGSTLYGNNAFLAVINVITRRGGELDGLELSGSAGSFDSYSGRITYGRLTDSGWEYLLSASIYDSAGHDSLHFSEFDTVNNGNAVKLDAERAIKFFGSVSYQDFTLEAAVSDRTKEVPTA